MAGAQRNVPRHGAKRDSWQRFIEDTKVVIQQKRLTERDVREIVKTVRNKVYGSCGW